MSASAITLLAVEDDPTQARILTYQLRALGYTLAAVAATATEAEVAFERHQPDLVLLDVHLAGPRDGIATAASLIGQRPVPLIFVTAFPDSATFARARQVGPFAFLGKPYNGPLLGHSIELAVQHFAAAQGQPPDAAAGELADGAVLLGGVFVREQGRFVKVPFAELLFVEADQGYAHLHTPARKYTVRAGLADLAARLPERQFCQIHRGYLVQIATLTAFDSSAATVLVGAHTLPVGRSYREALVARLGLVR